MKTKVANFLDIDIEDLKEVTKEQKKALREYTHNLWDMPQFYTDSHIIFTSEGANKHWRYYAGFEYLPDPETMKRGDTYICAYSQDQDDRIAKYLELLQETELTPS